MRKIPKLYEYFCSFLLGLAVTVVMGEIVSRTLFGKSYDILYSGPIWLVIWSVLLLSGPVLKQGGHVNVDTIFQKLRGKVHLTVDAFNSLCTIVYGALIALGGILLTLHYFTMKTKYALYFPIPVWIVMLCIPIGMTVFTFYAVWQLISVLKRGTKPPHPLPEERSL